MYNIKVEDLMCLERLLLEIDMRHKFDLSFEDAYMLYTSLKEVGKITSYFFLIQSEFNKKYNDNDKLMEYHNKLMNDTISFDKDEIIQFVDRIINEYGDDELKEVMNTIKFW